MSKVTITLEFDGKPSKEQVYSYIQELIADDSLNYDEQKSLCSCYEYQRLGACDHT
jgi:hypothetical protein